MGFINHLITEGAPHCGKLRFCLISFLTSSQKCHFWWKMWKCPAFFLSLSATRSGNFAGIGRHDPLLGYFFSWTLYQYQDWRPIRNRLNFHCEGHSIPISNIHQPDMFDPKNQKIHPISTISKYLPSQKNGGFTTSKYQRGLIEAEVGHDDDPPVSLREIQLDLGVHPVELIPNWMSQLANGKWDTLWKYWKYLSAK